MNKHEYDVAVIGSGPGGYVAAIRLQQVGLKAICIEKKSLGGVCLNIGCIPTKALIKSAEYVNNLKRAGEFGITLGDYSFDYSAIVARSRKVADQMSKGVAFLFKKYGVASLVGTAKITADKKVSVSDADGNATDEITAKHIIIATGARPRILPGIEVDFKNVITSTEALLGTEQPKSIIIMGAGAIGVEFAYFLNSLGTEVTIVEYLDRVLPIEDKDVSKELERHLRKDKIKLNTSCKVLSAKTVEGGVEVLIEKKDGTTETLKAEKALSAIGIQANIENLGLEEIGIETERGFIKINDKMQTNVPNVWAIGDVAGAPWLAHKASAEAIACAEIIAGHRDHGIDKTTIPGCTYCHPQVASVGLTEDAALAKGLELRIGKFPFTASGKAYAIGEAKGFVKLIFDKATDKLIGAHFIGPDVTEMIAEAGLAMHFSATGPDIFHTIHAHPTLSEAVMEAAANAWGEAVNI
ncbi:MAG: dihydrolipoyl dehydrogenase [bacterium]